MIEITGKIKHYLFHSEETGYSVAKAKCGELEVILVGHFPKFSSEIDYLFFGDYIVHPKHGKQFLVEKFQKIEVKDQKALVSYFSSDIFVGIGSATAQKIVGCLGDDAISKILNDKTVLRKEPLNFSAVKMERFYEVLVSNQEIDHILVELYSYGISTKTAMRLFNNYKLETLLVLKENSYQLIKDIYGIGFIKADEIAFKVGIKKDDPKRITAALVHLLTINSENKGNLYLETSELIEQARKLLLLNIEYFSYLEQLAQNKKIIIEDGKCYLAVNYYIEYKVVKKIFKILNQDSKILDLDRLKAILDTIEFNKGITYTEIQKEAIIKALVNPFSIITGGPGTGKTTIIDAILECYRVYHDYELAKSSSVIALMAPTGRAAKRMKEVLNVDAKTIHRSLGYNYEGEFAFNEKNRLPQKLVVVDETSMIDIYLANNLLEALSGDAQLVFVGDVDQLPSVGPGQLLSDLINSKRIPTVRLNIIHRQAKDSQIINLARAINIQNVKYDDLKSGNDLFLYHFDYANIKRIIIEQIADALKNGYKLQEDIQILIPSYRGEFGIDIFNKEIQEKFNPNKDHFMEYGEKVFLIGDKVIQLVNDPKRDIMNGDIGVVTSIGNNEKGEKYLVVEYDSNLVIYQKSDLEELNLAYAISIHKSQGSEYKIVFMPIVNSYISMLKKELIYTAITRAKLFLTITGDLRLLKYAANNLSEKRKTTLCKRLVENK